MFRRVNDAGMRNIEKALEKGNKESINVGVFADSWATRFRQGDMSDNLAYRYKKNDQGIGVPKRETLNPSIKKSMKTDVVARRLFDKLDKKGYSGLRADLGLLGQRLASNIKQDIRDLRSPKKSPATIRSYRKMFGTRRDNPLIRTGEMRNAVQWRYAN